MVNIHYLSEGRNQTLNFEFEPWLSSLCEAESKQLIELNIIFCSDDELLKKNIEILNHNYYTDIITLDYCVDDQIIGDLFISTDRLAENAKELDVNYNDERDRVVAHGILHLCGYGDKTEQEIAIMRGKEDFYLSLRPI